MNGKFPWQSRGFLGALIAIIAFFAGIWGWHVDADKTTDIIIQGIGLVAAVTALWGRIKADKPIVFTRTKPGGPFNPNAPVRKAQAVKLPQK